jgi:hypothetical protein
MRCGESKQIEKLSLAFGKGNPMEYAIIFIFSFMLCFYVGVAFVDYLGERRFRKHKEEMKREIEKIRNENN